MKLEDLTQEKLDEITNRLEKGKEAQTELQKLQEERKKLEEDIRLVSAQGADPARQKGAQERLLKRSGLYSDEQIREMLEQAHSEPEPNPDPPSEGDDSYEELVKLLSNDEQGDSELRQKVEQIQKKMDLDERQQRMQYLQAKIAREYPERFKEIAKKVAEESGARYNEPSDQSIEFFKDQAQRRVRERLGQVMKANGGQLPSTSQIDEVLEEEIPQHLEQVQSVISTPGSLGVGETVSGSTGVEDAFQLPEKPVEPPKVMDISEGKMSQDEADRQMDAARVDALTRAAKNSTDKASAESVV